MHDRESIVCAGVHGGDVVCEKLYCGYLFFVGWRGEGGGWASCKKPNVLDVPPPFSGRLMGDGLNPVVMALNFSPCPSHEGICFMVQVPSGCSPEAGSPCIFLFCVRYEQKRTNRSRTTFSETVFFSSRGKQAGI